ncbi:MAG: hypothetical protein AABY84_01780 [Candidatus Firestonebacteria bacterium]
MTERSTGSANHSFKNEAIDRRMIWLYNLEIMVYTIAKKLEFII